jgi:hypothetical protein
MATHWLRRLANRIRGHKTQPIRNNRTRTAGLFVEPLEERICLTTRTINVGTTADDLLVFGTLTAPSAVTSQPYSLREALVEAHRATEDTVIINLQAGAAYNITRPTANFLGGQGGNTEIITAADPFFGDFDIRRDIVINGNGAFVRGGGIGRVFQVAGSGVDVTLNNLTIENGGFVSDGAGLHVSGGANVTLNNVKLFNNVTPTNSNARGGGLYADNAGGRIVFNGGEFLGNLARSTAGGTARGGAIYLDDGQLEINGTQFRLNDAEGGAGVSGTAGGRWRTGLRRGPLRRSRHRRGQRGHVPHELGDRGLGGQRPVLLLLADPSGNHPGDSGSHGLRFPRRDVCIRPGGRVRARAAEESPDDPFAPTTVTAEMSGHRLTDLR